MANLELIRSLNKKYNKPSPFTASGRTFSINESFDVKSIDNSLKRNIGELGSNYTTYFDEGKEAEVVLLFIDVCNFSTRFSNLSGKQIGEFFDSYYDIVIPITYEFKGEIDKIMGDGIICIFGQPFLQKNLQQCIEAADACAKKIIMQTKGTKYSSKIAFHHGKVNYFKNKSGFYNELTVVGKPLTALFRLESISSDEMINYFVDYKYISNWNSELNKFSLLWKLSEIVDVPADLKGIHFKYKQTNEYLF